MAQSGGRGGKALNRIKSGAVKTGTNKVGVTGTKVPGGKQKNENNAFEPKSGQKKHKVD